MTICKRCGKDLEDLKTTACFASFIDYEDTSAPRVPYRESETERCPVCGVVPGKIHHQDCYMEQCPRCGKRLVSCGCLIRA
jgi:hypothetical protein